MPTDFKKHFLDYLILIFLLTFFLFLFLQNRGIPLVQYRLSVLASISYFLWGVGHHYSEGSLNLKIVVEYGLLAILVIVILKGVFL